MLKFFTTFILFLLFFIAFANGGRENRNCFNSENKIQVNNHLANPHFILKTKQTHKDYDFVIDIEEKEEDKKSKWLLAVIVTLFVDTIDYDIEDDHNCSYFLKNIILKQPRYILNEVFII